MNKLFFDSSTLIAALFSPKGGSGTLLSICEAKIIQGYISTEVIEEVEFVIKRKFPEVLELFREIVKASRLKIIKIRKKGQIEKAATWISDPNDAHVLAAAKQSKADYLITLDTKHFIKDKSVAKKAGLIIMTPGEFLQLKIRS